jgi:hypothetical protein
MNYARCTTINRTPAAQLTNDSGGGKRFGPFRADAFYRENSQGSIAFSARSFTVVPVTINRDAFCSAQRDDNRSFISFRRPFIFGVPIAFSPAREILHTLMLRNPFVAFYVSYFENSVSLFSVRCYECFTNRGPRLRDRKYFI